MATGERVCIKVVAIEFVEGGNTLWVHGPEGGTILRIKTQGEITSERCESPISHGDIMVPDNIRICVASPK